MICFPKAWLVSVNLTFHESHPHWVAVSMRFWARLDTDNRAGLMCYAHPDGCGVGLWIVPRVLVSRFEIRDTEPPWVVAVRSTLEAWVNPSSGEISFILSYDEDPGDWMLRLRALIGQAHPLSLWPEEGGCLE